MSRIHVCALRDLETTLQSSGSQWMISLSGPGKSQKRPEQIVGGYLALEFNDIEQPQAGLLPPGPKHIRQLLDFLNGWNGCGDIVIQCWMGISRSTAAAVIALAQQHPQADMIQLARSLRRQSPMATPNALMIALADDMLFLDGHLRDAIRSIGRGAEAPEGKPFSLDLHL